MLFNCHITGILINLKALYILLVMLVWLFRCDLYARLLHFGVDDLDDIYNVYKVNSSLSNHTY